MEQIEYSEEFENWWEKIGKIEMVVPVMELAFKEIAYKGWEAAVEYHFGVTDQFEDCFEA